MEDIDLSIDDVAKHQGLANMCSVLMGRDDGACDAELAQIVLRVHAVRALRTHSDGDYLGNIAEGSPIERGVVDAILNEAFDKIQTDGSWPFEFDTDMQIASLKASDYASSNAGHLDRFAEWQTAFLRKNGQRLAKATSTGLPTLVRIGGSSSLALGFGLQRSTPKGASAAGVVSDSSILAKFVAAPNESEERQFEAGTLVRESVILESLDTLQLLAPVNRVLDSFAAAHSRGEALNHFEQLTKLFLVASEDGSISFQPILRVLMMQNTRPQEKLLPGPVQNLFKVVDSAKYEMKKIIVAVMGDSPDARISDFIKAITTLERSPAKAQANGSYKWPGPDISMALCTCHVLMGTRKDQFDTTEVDIPKLTDAVAMKKPLAILAQICRARDVAVFHKSQLKVLFAAIESIELDKARVYNHSVVPLEARLVVAYIIGYKIYDLVLRQLEVIKNRSQFADAATTSKATDDFVSDVLGQSAPAPTGASTATSDDTDFDGLGLTAIASTFATGSAAGSVIQETSWRPTFAAATGGNDTQRPQKWHAEANKFARVKKALREAVDVHAAIKTIGPVPAGVAFKFSHFNFVVDVKPGDTLAAVALTSPPFVGSTNSKLLCHTSSHTWVLQTPTAKNKLPDTVPGSAAAKPPKKPKPTPTSPSGGGAATVVPGAPTKPPKAPKPAQVAPAVAPATKSQAQLDAADEAAIAAKLVGNAISKREMDAIDAITKTGLGPNGTGKASVYQSECKVCALDVISLALDNSGGTKLRGCQAHVDADGCRQCVSRHIFGQTKMVKRKFPKPTPGSAASFFTIAADAPKLEGLLSDSDTVDLNKLKAIRNILAGKVAPFSTKLSFLTRVRAKAWPNASIGTGAVTGAMALAAITRCSANFRPAADAE